jgi:exonuclease III
VCNLKAKFNELRIYIYHLKSEGPEFGAICLQETWIGDDNGSLHETPGYKNVFQKQRCSTHGGLTIYIKDSLNYDIIATPNYNTWETHRDLTRQL